MFLKGMEYGLLQNEAFLMSSLGIVWTGGTAYQHLVLALDNYEDLKKEVFSTCSTALITTDTRDI